MKPTPTQEKALNNMATIMDSMDAPKSKPRKNPIAPLCKKVLQVTDEDIAEIERIAQT